MNLKDETLAILKDYGKTKEDVLWVGCNKFKLPIDLFWKLADKNYHAGFGGQEVAIDLLVVGRDWWLERHEYDGSEWWEFKTIPVEPKKTKQVNTLMPGLWDTLDEQRHYEEESEE